MSHLKQRALILSGSFICLNNYIFFTMWNTIKSEIILLLKKRKVKIILAVQLLLIILTIIFRWHWLIICIPAMAVIGYVLLTIAAGILFLQNRK